MLSTQIRDRGASAMKLNVGKFVVNVTHETVKFILRQFKFLLGLNRKNHPSKN